MPTVKLPARIVSAPVVIPSAKGDAGWQVCVADAEGNLTLLREPDLKAEQPWPPLSGKITAGPFRRGQYLGEVVATPDRTARLGLCRQGRDFLLTHPFAFCGDCPSNWPRL